MIACRPAAVFTDKSLLLQNTSLNPTAILMPRFGGQPKVTTWVHPAVDPKVDQTRVDGVDEEDPRYQGLGPCEKLHMKYPVQPDSVIELPYYEFNGNAFGRWIDCRKCGMRLCYWPAHSHTGHYRKQWSPAVVLMAIEMAKCDIRNAYDQMDGKTFKLYLQRAEAEFRLGGPARAQQAKGKSKGKGYPSTHLPGSHNSPSRSPTPPPAKGSTRGQRASTATASASAARRPRSVTRPKSEVKEEAKIKGELTEDSWTEPEVPSPDEAAKLEREIEALQKKLNLAKSQRFRMDTDGEPETPWLDVKPPPN
jgi:hypothetical protein